MDTLDSFYSLVNREDRCIVVFFMDLFHLWEYLLCHSFETHYFFSELCWRSDMVEIALSFKKRLFYISVTFETCYRSIDYRTMILRLSSDIGDAEIGGFEKSEVDSPLLQRHTESFEEVSIFFHSVLFLVHFYYIYFSFLVKRIVLFNSHIVHFL